MPQIKIILGTVCTALAGFIGGIDGIMRALIIFLTLDYITGVLAAAKKRELSSEVGFWGLVKKCAIIALVGVSHVIDVEIMDGESTFRTAVALYYIGNEGVSMAENLAALGIPLPQKLKEMLAQLKSGNDKNKEE